MPLHIKLKPLRHRWMCQRCFHAQLRLYSEQQPVSSSSASRTSEKPESTVEAFRRKYLQQKSQDEPPKQSISPAERFRTNWSLGGGGENQAAAPIEEKKEKLMLGDLAAAYRLHGASRKYVKKPVRSSFRKKEIDDSVPEELDPGIISNYMNELSRLDEMEKVPENDEIFAGENFRDYQGVLPLNGENYSPQRFPIKSGDLVETRGYSIFALQLLRIGNTQISV